MTDQMGRGSQDGVEVDVFSISEAAGKGVGLGQMSQAGREECSASRNGGL